MFETCCFIGQRPHELFPFDRANAHERDRYTALRDELQKRIEQLCEIGVETFLSGGGQGAEQIAFWAVHRAKKQFPHIKNVLCMPFESYGRNWNHEGAFGKGDLVKMVNYADRIDIVTEGTPAKRDIPQTLFECNHYMVDHADIVLGVTREREFLKAEGGTAECLRYARQQDKKIRVIHPIDREVTQFEILQLSPWDRLRK